MKDATSDYSDQEMQAAFDVNLPSYAKIVSTEELVEAFVEACIAERKASQINLFLAQPRRTFESPPVARRSGTRAKLGFRR